LHTPTPASALAVALALDVADAPAAWPFSGVALAEHQYVYSYTGVDCKDQAHIVRRIYKCY